MSIEQFDCEEITAIWEQLPRSAEHRIYNMKFHYIPYEQYKKIETFMWLTLNFSSMFLRKTTKHKRPAIACVETTGSTWEWDRGNLELQACNPYEIIMLLEDFLHDDIKEARQYLTAKYGNRYDYNRKWTASKSRKVK